MTRLLLTVSSGLGPVEVRRFVRALADALERELPARGLRLEARVEHGPPSEPRSVDLALRGDAGALEDLVGSHALVLRSARRGKRARKRWYAGVSVARGRAGGDRAGVAIDVADVRFETCRAGGAGGQHVNKTESAVRATHAPSGLSVRVETERSQLRNKRAALETLARMLDDRAAAERADAARARRGRSLRLERGAPVATWRLGRDGLVRADTEGRNDAT